MFRLLAIAAILALTSARRRYKRVGEDCNATTGNITVASLGRTGASIFYRYNKTERRFRWIKMIPIFLREYEPRRLLADRAVRGASGFATTGTNVTWTCGDATFTSEDPATGVDTTQTGIGSHWRATRKLWDPQAHNIFNTEQVTLGFETFLFSKSWFIKNCPRRPHSNKTGTGAFFQNSTQCSVVQVPGVGVKWSFYIDNWPYRKDTNYLLLRMRIQTRAKISALKSFIRARKVYSRRKQAARQLFSVGEGYLDNPEEAKVTCVKGDGSVVTSTQNVTITAKAYPIFGFLDVTYKFAPTGDNCTIEYDPFLTTDPAEANTGATTTSTTAGPGQTTTQSGDVGRISGVIAAMFALCFGVFFV